MNDCKTVDTPIVEKVTGEADNRELEDEEQKRFQKITNCLIYLATNTRCDISYGVIAVAKDEPSISTHDSSEKNPEVHQRKAVTGNHLQDGRLYSQELYGCLFCNSNFLNHKSASGFLVTLGGGPIVYGAQIQRVVALNTCEAGLLAMNTLVNHILYILGLIAELGLKQNRPTPIFCYNGAACTISQVGNFTKRQYIAIWMAHP